MTVPASPATTEDRDLYPLHEEDDVPEKPRHERQNGYLRSALRARLPGWFVTGNVCIYWEPGSYEDYAAPDVMVVRDWQPEEEPSVYFTWSDPPVVFVGEIFSASQSATQQSKKEEEYATLVRVREYLSYHQERGELRLRRLGPSGYEEIPPEPDGRVRSQELQLEFGVDRDGFLWVYTLDGERLQTYEELDLRVMDEAERRTAAEARVASEARRREAAEQRAVLEARQRQEAEARAAEEARQRQEAEARAADEVRQRGEEARRREAAEARAVELERQLAELRAHLQERGE